MAGWQETKNEDYLRLIRNRIENVHLVWVEQFLDLITDYVDVTRYLRINDIGCQAFQFYKGLCKRGLYSDYFGYDIEQQYLDLGLRQFPELKSRCGIADIQKELPRPCDVTIVSATLEHLFDYRSALNNIVKTTRSLCLIRTFLADETNMEIVYQVGAKKPYHLNEFSRDEIVDIFEKAGFAVEFAVDRYTNGEARDISLELEQKDKVMRSQTVILAKYIN